MRSMLLTRMGDEGGYLVRLYPVAIGEGIVTLPAGETVLGRDSDCGVVLQDADVSRRHAVVTGREGQFTIRDLKSTNGTFVNDARVGEKALGSGDRITVGKVILKFLRGNEVEKQYHETIYAMMILDGLTGVPNKRFLEDTLNREVARSQRHKRPLSVAMLDLDHFKKINDTYGHLAGDAVLREICRRLKTLVGADEVLARYGGEEFVAVLPEAGVEQAREFAERMRELAAEKPVEVDGQKIAVTISVGVAHTAGEAEMTAAELVKRADKLLYEAKAAGRNRVKG
ncbi:MAG: GGDEF domain-containing protein [Planctomycetes bacterium]|nr:GGDEF domain-containing protein [Planctomycetota bacterium]